jgi:hypothetical protein
MLIYRKMRKVAFFRFLIPLILFGPLCSAQKKIKYKDIFGLLSTKQYEQAEPFLKTYLKENDDNPNAFLFMGIIFQEKALKDDVLKQTKLSLAHMDSAHLYFTKAYQTITEKEIKKNDELYQSYNRRDLRTGEFGVKLSDVQFDMEKRMEGLKERIDRVKMIKHYFVLADTLYKKSVALYGTIVAPFENDKEFFLRANEGTIKSLSLLSSRFDSCTKAFEQYRGSLATIGKSGYAPSLTKVEIKNFRAEGKSGSDFYKDDIQVWDYKLFAQTAKQSIETDIFPLREHLISYDVEINKLREKLNTDSVSVKSDLTKLIERLLLGQLRKYDPTPLPMDVFYVKIADLDYKSTLLESKPFRDSSDLHLQIKLAEQALQSVQKLDSVTGRLLARNIDYEIKNYEYFVSNTYSNATVLKSFIKVVKEYAEREKKLREAELLNKKSSLQWMVVGSDSVPLFMDKSSSKYKPLAVISERYTAGVKVADSLKLSGYFFSITPSRIPDIKVSFPLERNLAEQSAASTAHSLTYSDASGQIFFVLVFSEKPNKENKYSATVAKIYRSDGLAWSGNYALSFVPKEVLFKTDTGEFVMRADAQESVVDKNGKLLR